MWLTGSASYVFYTLVFTGVIVGGHCYLRRPTLKAKATNLVSDIATGIKQDISDVETVSSMLLIAHSTESQEENQLSIFLIYCCTYSHPMKLFTEATIVN